MDAESFLRDELPTAVAADGSRAGTHLQSGTGSVGTGNPGPAGGSVDGKSTLGSRGRLGQGKHDGGETVGYAASVHPGHGLGGAGKRQQGQGRGEGGFQGFVQVEDDNEDATHGLISPEDDIGSIDQSTYFGWRLANMRYSTRQHREDEFRLYTAERAYRQMTAHFGQTAMAHVLAAEFYHHFCFENNFAEAQALSQARLRAPTLDLDAHIRSRTVSLRDGSDDTKLSSMDRVIFESLSRQAQESKMGAMRSILHMWDHLSGHKLDLARIVDIGDSIYKGLSRTDRLYKSMMQLNQGALVAREYAEFLVEMTNDQTAAASLFSKADRLEERHSRQRA